MIAADTYTTQNTDLFLFTCLLIVLILRARAVRRYRRRRWEAQEWARQDTPWHTIKGSATFDLAGNARIKIVSNPYVPPGRIVWWNSEEAQKLHDAFTVGFNEPAELYLRRIGMLGVIEMQEWPFDYELDAPEIAHA